MTTTCGTGQALYQSARQDRYAAALDALQRSGHIYPCACTRREVADSALAGIEGHVYPGTCRAGLPPGREARAWRVRTNDEPLAFIDELRSAGIRFRNSVESGPGGKQIQIEDPDGNPIELFEPAG